MVATRNPGKLGELAPMLEAAGFFAVDLASLGLAETAEEDELESHDSFEGNALAKARHFAALLPGYAVLADDSGLVVEALGGAPGVRSKRWSGRSDLKGRELDAANNARLARELEGVTERDARFVCAAAWVGPDGEGGTLEMVALGDVRGRILDGPRGEDGFGYDPYFRSEELGRSFGESSREEKAAVSHRARAVRALLESLPASVTTSGEEQDRGAR
ncbi:MAG TPA: non-canonical purine NTP pyrophosphatase [Gemmatimonadales bacterium]